MRLAKKKSQEIQEGDLTPMIDMTFQLIAFFMVLINFSEVERTEEIKLPGSQLAKPPEEPPDYRILLNIQPNADPDKEPRVSFAGAHYTIPDAKLSDKLRVEVDEASRQDIPPGEIVVIIRSDKDTRMLDVQRLIAKCQEKDLESFSLRVKEQVAPRSKS